MLCRIGEPAALLEPPSRPPGRLVVICRPTEEALVLGSAQREPPTAGAPGDLPVVRRRSGGAALLVAPGAQCWLDVYLPPGDPLVQSDVGRTAWWLGESWAGALAALLPACSMLSVHRGPNVRDRWSSLACFTGIGPGEVSLDGRKVVGISQRRGAFGVWLHSMALLSFDPARLAGMLAADHDEASELAGRLLATATALGDPRFDGGLLGLLEAGVLARLPPHPHPRTGEEVA